MSTKTRDLDIKIIGLIVASALNNAMKNHVAKLLIYRLKLFNPKQFYNLLLLVRSNTSSNALIAFRNMEIHPRYSPKFHLDYYEKEIDAFFEKHKGKHYSIHLDFPIMFLCYFRITSLFT